MIPADIENYSQNRSRDLTENRGGSCPGYSHSGRAQQTEYQDRIHYHVYDSSRSLCDHIVNGLARRLEQSLKYDLHIYTKAQGTAYLQVSHSVLHYIFAVCLKSVKRLYKGKSYHKKHQIAEHGQEYAVGGGLVDQLVILFAKGLAEQGVYSDAHTDPQCDHQRLHRKSHGNRRKCIFLYPRYKNRIHYII